MSAIYKNGTWYGGDSNVESTQVKTLPTAAANLVGTIYQYIGATNENYTNGYFYECVSDGAANPTYSWEQKDTQPGAAIPDISGKQNKIQFDTMPTASASNEGDIVQYIGTTNVIYTNGHFYKCISDGDETTPTYSWEPWSIQDNIGGDVFKGSLFKWNTLTVAEKESYKVVVLTELHPIDLVVGDQYTINEKTFKVAEDLGNGVYAMQANSSWGTSAWPGYLAAGGYTSSDFSNRSIAPYVTAANTWYDNNVKAMESDDYKYGPYLISYSKAQLSYAGMMGRWNCGGPYVAVMKEFVSSGSNCAWIGAHGGDRIAYVISSSYANNPDQASSYLIAPAFNLDTKKVVIDDSNVITPGSSAGEVFTYNPLSGGLEAVGHTIVDSNGEEMPSRLNLKFGGDFSVTDDSTNDETVVTPHRLTSEEMQEIVSPLPAAQRVMPILVDETCAEYVVGRYKRASDGKMKPVYEKILHRQAPSSSGRTQLNHNIQNVENIWVEKAWFTWSTQDFFMADGSSCLVPHIAGVSTTTFSIFGINNTVIEVLSDADRRTCSWTAFVRYTKTTDEWQ